MRVDFVLGRRGRLVAAALVLGAAVGVVPHSARASADLGGYELTAHAPVLELVVDSDALPVPAHPVFDATVPETTSSLESGLGHGLASLVWPGDLAGHFGSAVKQLGQLCTSMLPIALPNVPTECTPLPQQVKDNAGALNDPVKAETFYPGGPTDDSYTSTPPLPGVTMKSHAAADKVESVAGFASLAAPGLGTLGSVTSRSVTSTTGGTATSEATSELFNIGLAGGLVAIDHVQSTAKDSTDGEKAIGAGNTVIDGLRIGGVPVSINGDGLHIGALSTAANNALANLGLEIKLTAPAVLTEGAKGSFSAPLLTISYRDDQNALEAAAAALGQKLSTGPLQQLTSGLQQLTLGPQAKVTASVGGTVATVDASQTLPVPPDTTGATPVGGETQPAVVSTAATNGSPPAVESLTFTAATPASVSRSARSLPAAHSSDLLGGFGGLAWGLVLAAVAASLALAFGLYRYALATDVAGARDSLH
ncbi:MAG: hypothetical protein JOZ68_13580 [Acidimicrobiia bacterium]|nr:hypothetical protein [Acidimicrobiia bacterium]